MEQFEMLMSQVIKPLGNTPVYNCMVTVNNEDSGVYFSGAKGHTSETGQSVLPDFGFRTGSITKLFTAAIILQLKEEGLFRLDEYYLNVINNDTRKVLTGLHLLNQTDYSDKISILHLLQHASGLQDYFSGDDRFLEYVMQHPLQLWDWKIVMRKYFELQLNLRPLFVPGNGFHYSDTNYLLLAVLIEQITRKSLQEVYRERIITPLGLADTYLEFYEEPGQAKLVVYPYYGIHSLENINTSFDWGGGGLMSTMIDLDTFIRALMKGRLFDKQETLDLMMQIKNTNQSIQYGIGVQKRDFPGYSFVGHNSAYGSMLFYEPEKDLSIILSLNQAAALQKAEWLMRKIALSYR